MRRQFGKTIVELGRKDPTLVVLYGDVKQNMDEFEAEFPDRIFNVGICEQSMVSMAAGIALSGLRPVVYSLTPFLIERGFEQIKMDLDGMNSRVILVSYDSYPTHGISQTPVNPEILMSCFKNVKSFFPRSSTETITALDAAHMYNGPTFVRLMR